MEKNTKKCEVCGRELPLSGFSKSYRNRCKECVAAQVRSERQNKHTEKSEECSVKQSPIDWEQRRYEIARQMMPVLSERGYKEFGCFIRSKAEDVARNAVYYADALIAELKK